MDSHLLPTDVLVISEEGTLYKLGSRSFQSCLYDSDTFSIFSATDDSGRELALKIRNTGEEVDVNNAREYAIKEAIIWGNMKHKFILPFWGTCMIGDGLYLVAPRTKNGLLLKYLETYPEKSPMELMAEVASALEFLHGEGVVHGNIQPDSIYVSDDGHAYLSGFEFSKSDTIGAFITMPEFVGPYYYMSPEIHDIQCVKTTASDVYAFGITMAQALGRTAFPYPQYTKSLQAFYQAVVVDGERPKMPGGMSGDLAVAWDMAAWCWDPNPARRPSMTEVREGLEALIHSGNSL